MSTVAEPYASPPPAKPAHKPAPARPPRWLPAVLLVLAYWIARWVAMNPLSGTFAQFMFLMFAPLALALGVLIWLLAFSRFRWFDRGWILLWLLIGGLVGTFLSHPSMGIALLMFMLPAVLTTSVLYVYIAKCKPKHLFRLGVAVVSLATCSFYTLLRFDGVTGAFATETNWRFSPTAEQKFFAEQKTTPKKALAHAIPAITALVATPADWPEFRGPNRDSRVTGVRINTDWKTSPPRLLWSKRVGPSWSSFAVVGDLAFTQEQRGEEEAVVCYRIGSGEELWAHTDATRFEETISGPGPRATPTFHHGKLYTLGSQGTLNCLDPTTGEPVWSRDIAADSGAATPMWGFSSSPLVTSGLVIVVACGPKDANKGTLAYDAATGKLVWSAGSSALSYASAQHAVIDGIEQVLVASDIGLESFDLKSGAPLWFDNSLMKDMARIVQPHRLPGGAILVGGSGFGNGTRSLAVTKSGQQWNVEEQWTSKALSPYFNDFVSHEGFIYGFDGTFLACMDANTGERKWKARGYDSGQILLLADQGLLLVISEAGGIFLLEANPNRAVELGRIEGLHGKTWNHPVLVRNKLLVKNSQEMACYELK